MAKARIWSAERSSHQLRSDSATLKKAQNTAWSAAKKAPLFLKKPKFVGTGKAKKRATMTRFGKEVFVPQRSNRCIRSSTMKVLLSGAAAEAAAVLGKEAKALKTEVAGEANVAAALPKLSVGAEILFEHALVAYCQTICDSAVRLKNSMSIHEKVSLGCVTAAAEIVNKEVFKTATLAPGRILITSRRKAGGKKGKKAEDAAEAAEAAASADA